MNPLLRTLASNRLMMAGFALLAAGTIASYKLPGVPRGAILGPLGLLALNLLAAIAMRPALRRGGLGLFHVCLLVLMLLAGWGRLVHLDGRVEVTEGTVLDPAQVEVSAQGPLHGDAWRLLAFQQGLWEVDYAPRVWRTHTRSQVWLPGERAPLVVGDDTPLVLDGYRFYTTSNKGFAPVLTWHAEGAEPVTGVLHMPSYPALEWKQEQAWKAPDGRELRFRLRVEARVPQDARWTLAPHSTPAVLVVSIDGKSHELRAAQSVQLHGATLRFDRLSGWMGYKIFYDPTLIPMLLVALAGVAGLAWHLWQRAGALAPAPADGVPA